STAGPAALDVVGVGHRYGARVALRDVSFSVKPASFTVLLGLNGAGKSTTMKMVTGFLDPTSGSIAVGGTDLTKDPLAAKR
ncbi:ATP-binding cassette domain-containing protein, partial [Acinetobacter baumannii]